MINTVRLWTRKPSQVSIKANYGEEKKSRQGRKTDSRSGFFTGFFKMWEFQAELILKNIDDEAK